MKVLFLDDCPVRHKEFMENWIGHLVDWAWTAEQAKKFLEVNEYDLVMLDHDLEQQHYAEKCFARTGGEVAQFMANTPERFEKTNIIVHSLNFDGRKRIIQILKSVGLEPVDLPWGWMKVKP